MHSCKYMPNGVFQTCNCTDIGFGSVDEILLRKECDHKLGLGSRKVLHTADMNLKACFIFT